MRENVGRRIRNRDRGQKREEEKQNQEGMREEKEDTAAKM